MERSKKRRWRTRKWEKDGQKRCLKVLREAILMLEMRVLSFFLPPPYFLWLWLSAIVQVSGKCVRGGDPESNPGIPMLFLTKFTVMSMFESTNVSIYWKQSHWTDKTSPSVAVCHLQMHFWICVCDNYCEGPLVFLATNILWKIHGLTLRTKKISVLPNSLKILEEATYNFARWYATGYLV